MASRIPNNLILPRAAIQKTGGVVILDLPQYEKIKKKIERLREEKRRWREEEEVLEIIKKGEREYREGKIQPIKSLKELR